MVALCHDFGNIFKLMMKVCEFLIHLYINNYTEALFIISIKLQSLAFMFYRN